MLIPCPTTLRRVSKDTGLIGRQRGLKSLMELVELVLRHSERGRGRVAPVTDVIVETGRLEVAFLYQQEGPQKKAISTHKRGFRRRQPLYSRHAVSSPEVAQQRIVQARQGRCTFGSEELSFRVGKDTVCPWAGLESEGKYPPHVTHSPVRKTKEWPRRRAEQMRWKAALSSSDIMKRFYKATAATRATVSILSLIHI